MFRQDLAKKLYTEVDRFIWRINLGLYIRAENQNNYQKVLNVGKIEGIKVSEHRDHPL